MTWPWEKPSTGPKEIILEHRLLEGDLKPVVAALEFLLLEAEQRVQGDASRSHIRTLMGNLRAALES